MSHLEPPDSLFDTPGWCVDYKLSVIQQLDPGVDERHIAASVFCLPSFDPEWAVFVTRDASHHAIQFTIANQSIWGREINQDVGVRRSERALPEDMAVRITAAFELALAKVRYRSQRSLRCDGATLHFSACGLAGQTWSPPPETIPGKLTSLALAMRNHTIWSKDRFDESIAAMTAASEWIEANHHIEPSIQDDDIEAEFTELEQ